MGDLQNIEGEALSRHFESLSFDLLLRERDQLRGENERLMSVIRRVAIIINDLEGES